MNTDRYNEVIARADRVMRRVDERGGPAQAAARRERQRLNADLGRRLKRIGVGIGLVSIAAIVVGLVTPIGMFGFLAAVGLAIGIAAMVAFLPSQERTAAAPSADLPNGAMVQRFDSATSIAAAPPCPPPRKASSTRSAPLCRH